MKSKWKWAGKTVVGILGVGLLVANPAYITARAEVGVTFGVNVRSVSDFYSPLSAYGAWVNVGSYGRCWHPVGVAVGWRPYTVGSWEWTDAGWYWASDEPWGWACGHYGGWVMDPTYGWVWVPGTEWAPAWVVWREAPDYIGWAPCGPGGVAVSDSTFCFVDVHHFHDRLGPRELVFNDARIFGRSKPVGGFQRETMDLGGVKRQIAYNRGPGVDPIQRATGTRFAQKRVSELVRQAPAPSAAKRNSAQAETERSRMNTATTQPRLYREAPQPAPTGREEPRIYREAPKPQPAPQPQRPETEVPRRQSVPEAPAPTAQPKERAVPPPVERGHNEGQEKQVPRRAEPAPRESSGPRQAPPPAPSREKEKEREGQ